MDAEFGNKISKKGKVDVLNRESKNENQKKRDYHHKRGIWKPELPTGQIDKVYKHGELWDHESKINISEDSVNKYKLKKTIDASINVSKAKRKID